MLYKSIRSSIQSYFVTLIIYKIKQNFYLMNFLASDINLR